MRGSGLWYRIHRIVLQGDSYSLEALADLTGFPVQEVERTCYQMRGAGWLTRSRGEYASPPTPAGLGPWVSCGGCHRRYRPRSAAGRCYDCRHQCSASGGQP